MGGGCFWCLDALYKRVQGVTLVESGYAGGTVPDPTYWSVYNGDTGHAEVVRVNFNPAVIDLKTLIDIFWAIHDPTTLNRQGADIGTDYRSIILYNSDQQKEVIDESLNKVGKPLWEDKSPIVTEIKALDAFYLAEEEHQDWANRNPRSGYCNIVINPKLKNFKEQFADLLV
jgi:peptide-methionine (S)-S-oxide reductase